jgi:hypothetical protein
MNRCIKHRVIITKKKKKKTTMIIITSCGNYTKSLTKKRKALETLVVLGTCLLMRSVLWRLFLGCFVWRHRTSRETERKNIWWVGKGLEGCNRDLQSGRDIMIPRINRHPCPPRNSTGLQSRAGHEGCQLLYLWTLFHCDNVPGCISTLRLLKLRRSSDNGAPSCRVGGCYVTRRLDQRSWNRGLTLVQRTLRHSPGETQENHIKAQSEWSIIGPRLKPGTIQI